MRSKVQEDPVGRAVAALAGRQHGIVGRGQLAELGLHGRSVDRRIACGLLHPLYRGVYAVGHTAVSREARRLAAVLAIGSETWLSFRSAGAHWGMRSGGPGRVEVTTVRSVRSRPGIQVHHCDLPADEVTVHDGIPITTPPRTLLDLAAVLRPHQLERALYQADTLRLTDPLSVDDLIARYPRRHGVPKLRRLLRTGPAPTRSDLEAAFLAFLDARRLPRPQINPTIEVNGTTLEPDCLWPTARLIVELDSWTFHAPRKSFESDRARDRNLQAAGWTVVRVTWRQLRDEPDAIAAALHELLATPPAAASAPLPAPPKRARPRAAAPAR